MVSSAVDWPWSSDRATAGQTDSHPWQTTDWLLASFSHRKRQAIHAYKAFVGEGKGPPSIWSNLRHQIHLGSDRFVEEMQTLIEDKALSEIPLSQRRAAPHTLAYYVQSTESRNDAIVMAYESGGYRLKDIGEYLGLHYSTVSDIVKNHKSKT